MSAKMFANAVLPVPDVCEVCGEDLTFTAASVSYSEHHKIRSGAYGGYGGFSHNGVLTIPNSFSIEVLATGYDGLFKFPVYCTNCTHIFYNHKGVKLGTWESPGEAQKCVTATLDTIIKLDDEEE